MGVGTVLINALSKREKWQYADGVCNTTENSSVFSLIRIC